MDREQELEAWCKLMAFGYVVFIMTVVLLVVFGFRFMPFVQQPCTLEYPEYPLPMPVPTPLPIRCEP